MLLTNTGTPNADDRDAPTIPVATADDSAASAFQGVLAQGLLWLRVNEAEASEGSINGVHHLRTTTRRLRSALTLFGPLVEPRWAEPLAQELKWLGGLLGEVRDLDVLGERFRKGAKALELHDDLAPLFDALDTRIGPARLALHEAIHGPRFRTLVDSLDHSIAALPLDDAAWQPCRDTLPALAARSWKGLKRRARALDAKSPDDDFHEARKYAKRARYDAETVRASLDPGPGRAAKAFARRARDVQDVLGEHQDATVAINTLREVVAGRPTLGAFNFAAGQLLHRERLAADASRDHFFQTWPALDRKKNVRWLQP